MMGMFDEVRCEYPLPAEGANKLVYQTKSFWCPMMDSYTIREDGTLWVEEYRTEDRSDPNAEGFERIIGMMHRVPTGQRQITDTMALNFYTDEGGEWVEWVALYDEGRLLTLKRVPDARGRG